MAIPKKKKTTTKKTAKKSRRTTKKTTKKGSPLPADDPDKTLIVAGDDGNFYKIVQSEWQSEANRITDPKSIGVVKSLTDFGTYLAAIPSDIAVGSGLECVLVNINEIVK